MKMTRPLIILTWIFVFTLCTTQLHGQKNSAYQRADSLLKLMTLKEKIGQLNQYNDDWGATGPVTVDPGNPYRSKAS